MKKYLLILMLFISIPLFAVEKGEINQLFAMKAGWGTDTGGLGIGIEYKYKFIGFNLGGGYANDSFNYSIGLRGYYDYHPHAAFFAEVSYGAVEKKEEGKGNNYGPVLLGGIITSFNHIFAELSVGGGFIDTRFVVLYQLSIGLSF